MNDQAQRATVVESAGANGADESHYYNCNTDRYGYSTSIGIDTVGFVVSEFRISEGAELQVRQKSNAATGETGDHPLYCLGGGGPVIVGSRAFINCGPISVTVYDPDCMHVEASLPNVLGQNNRQPVDTSHRFEMALKAIQERLKTLGIEADLVGADITRLDICRNVRTDDRLPDYEPVLQRCSFPRTELRRYEDGGYHWTNGSRQINFYGKGAKEGTDPQVQRLEYRLTKKRSVGAQIDVKSVARLLENFGAVRQAYRSAVDDLLPDVESVQEASTTSLRGTILMIMEEARKRTSCPHSMTLKALGVRYLQEQGAQDDFLRALQEDADRMAASRYRNTIDELTPLADLLSGGGRTATEMLLELRKRLLT